MLSNSTNELLQDFMQPTEPKGPAAVEIAPEPEPVSAAPEIEAPEVEEVQEKPEKVASGLSAGTLADIYISVADGTQTLIFNSINKKKLARRLGDKLPIAEKLINEIECGRLSPSDLSEEQYALFMRIKTLIDVSDSIPFTDEEYTRLKEPLTKIIQESGHDLPPSMALVLVGLEVMAPRIVDAMFE